MFAHNRIGSDRIGRGLGTNVLSVFKSDEATGAEIYRAIRLTFPQAGGQECSIMVARWERVGFISSIHRPTTEAGASVTYRAYRITNVGRRFFSEMP